MKVFCVAKNNLTSQSHFIKEVQSLEEAVAIIQQDRASKFLANKGKLSISRKDDKTTYIQADPSDEIAYAVLE